MEFFIFGNRQPGTPGKHAFTYLYTGSSDLVAFSFYALAYEQPVCHLQRRAENRGLGYHLAVE